MPLLRPCLHNLLLRVMMSEDAWYIYPLVRKTVGRLSTVCVLLVLVCALLAVLEFVLLSHGAIVPGLMCGLGSELLYALVLCSGALLYAWGHRVLLACGGVRGSWFLSHLAVIFSVVMVCCMVYSLCGGDAGGVNYSALPYLICPLLLTDILINFNNMAALSLSRRVLLPLVVVVALAVALTAHPALLVVNIVLKIALAATAAPLLRALARLAPLVISLPEPEPPFTPPAK